MDLQDPQFLIPTILALVGVLVSVGIALFQRSRKSLSYEIVTSNALLTASEEIRGQVEILFNKMPVQNVHLLVVKFTNDGNVPIQEVDFADPLQVYFAKDTQILSAGIIENSPETFRPTFITDDDSTVLEIQPTLMNSKDSFTVKFLLSQYTQGEMKFMGRIVGVREITQTPSLSFLQRTAQVLLLLSGVALIGGLVAQFISATLSRALLYTAGISFLLAIAVASFIPNPPETKKKD